MDLIFYKLIIFFSSPLRSIYPWFVFIVTAPCSDFCVNKFLCLIDKNGFSVSREVDEVLFFDCLLTDVVEACPVDGIAQTTRTETFLRRHDAYKCRPESG